MRLGWLSLALLVGFAGCTADPGFRSPEAPITSTTRFDLARFAGDWSVVARMAAPGDPLGPMPESFGIGPGQGGAFAIHHDYARCSDGGCVAFPSDRQGRIIGPGRYLFDAGGPDEAAHWVLWTDADYRTAVIGAPDGRIGMILNRGPAISADRLRAAREILEWNGYDLSRLVTVRQADE